MTSFFNHPKLKERRRQLRSEQTDSEKTLWKSLKNKQLEGFRFLRQFSVGPYILDFYCPEKRLGVEVDGGHHAEIKSEEYDVNRSEVLKMYNIKILRFWNNEVLNNVSGVLEEIFRELSNPS